MKHKLLLFLCLLCMAVGRTWAETITWGPSGTGDDNTGANYIGLQVDQDCKLTSIALTLAGNGTATATYMVISTATTPSSVSSSNVVGYSTNQPGTVTCSSQTFTYRFNSLSLTAGTYYIYFTTKSNAISNTNKGSTTSTLTTQRIRLIKNTTYTPGLYWSSTKYTTYSPIFTATATVDKTLSSIAISGTPTKTTYEAGDAFDPTGLTVTGTYNDASTADVTSSASWAFDPATLTYGTTSCTATATVGSVSAEYNATITVNKSTLQTLYDNDASSSASSAHYYRIPAIAVDPSGNLYAYADYRTTPGYDIGGGDNGTTNHIDVQVRKSTDNGENWTDIATAVSGQLESSTNDFDYSHGDAAVVADREGKGFLMMCASGNVRFINSTTTAPIRVGRYTSTDGVTWSGSDVTSTIYEINFSGAANSVTGVFFSSGRICQSRFIKVGEYYRLYAALDAYYYNGSTRAAQGSIAVYSDDFGETWKQLGTTIPAASGDEAKIEELPNGNVLISSRMSGGRYFNIYTYTSRVSATGAWSTVATSNSSDGGTYSQNCSANGEILIVPAKNSSDENCYVALQSIPKGGTTSGLSGRENLVVYYKVLSSFADFDYPEDFTTGWSLLKQINSTSSCYSTMVLDKNGDIAFIYEEGKTGEGYNIKFQTLSLSTLTSGAYTYSADLLTEANNNTYLGITTVDDLVGKTVTLKCVGATTPNEYLYKNSNAIGTTSTEPTTSDTQYQFIVAKGFNGGYTFQSASNTSLYLGVATSTSYNVALESAPAEFILTKSNQSTQSKTNGDSPVTMTGYALQYLSPQNIKSNDNGVVFVALKNVDGTATDHLSYTTTNYNSYSTDFTIETTSYSITCNDATNGTVTADVTSAASGATVTLTVTPDTGYELSTLTVKDASDNEIAVTSNTFTMPASNVTVTATFMVSRTEGEKINDLITAAAGAFPVDVTSALDDADGSTIGHWTTTSTTNQFAVNTWSVEGNTDGSNMTTPFLQSWISGDSSLPTQTISHQTITGLAEGYYEVSILARIYSEAGNSLTGTATFNVNSNPVDMLTSGTACTYGSSNGVYGTYTKQVHVDQNGSLDINFNIDEANFNWIAFKNMKITYLGHFIVKKTYDCTLPLTLGGSNEGTSASFTLDDIYTQLGTDATALDALINGDRTSANVYTLASAGEGELVTTADAGTDGWFGLYTVDGTTFNAPMSWGAGCTIYCQSVKLSEGTLSMVTGQYPGTYTTIGTKDSVKLYIPYGFNAVCINIIPKILPTETITPNNRPYAIKVADNQYVDMGQTTTGSDGGACVTVTSSVYPFGFSAGTNSGEWALKSEAAYYYYLRPYSDTGSSSVGESLTEATAGDAYKWTIAGNNNAFTVARADGKFLKVNGTTVTCDNDEGTTFSLVPLYIIWPEVSGNGKINVSGYQAVLPNTEVTLTFTPETGYYLKSYTVTYTDNENVHTMDITPGTAFTMPEYDIHVTAVFAVKYTITCNTPTNGTITSSSDLAFADDVITLTPTPSSIYDYELYSLVVKDASNNNVTVNADNTFTMPASNVTVEATFSTLGKKYDGKIVTLTCTGYAGSTKTEDNTFVRYVYAPTDVTASVATTTAMANKHSSFEYMFYMKATDDEYRNFTFQSVSNPAYYLGYDGSDNMSLQTKAQPFRLKKYAKFGGWTAYDMDGYALTSPRVNTSGEDSICVAISSAAAPTTDKTNFSKQNYNNSDIDETASDYYYSTDFTITNTSAATDTYAYLERATTDTYYGTICLPFNFTFDTEYGDLYKASFNVYKTEIVLDQVTSGEAGIPYIYKASSETDKNYQKFTYTVNAPVVPSEGYPILGVYTATTTKAGDYVLQSKNGGAQKFYKVASGKEVTVPAYKAYIPKANVTSSVRKEYINFEGMEDDEETAISALNALTSGEAKIYDLNGRQLQKLQKGINIVNGVKVIVK